MFRISYKALFLFKITILIIYNLYGQNDLDLVTPLKIGEKPPDILLTLMRGENLRSIHLSDLHGRLIIFDFWGIHCGSCITAMPRLLELQNHFKDTADIFLVTEDSGEKLMQELKELSRCVGKSVSEAVQKLTFIVGDTVLERLFPHMLEPMHVWVDSSLVYRAIAFDWTTTKETIERFIHHQEVDWDRYDYNAKIYDSIESIVDSNFRYKLSSYSIVSGYNDQLKLQHALDETDPVSQKKVGVGRFNTSLSELYSQAYFKCQGGSYGDTAYISYSPILIGGDSIAFYHADYYNAEQFYLWRRDHSLNYILKILPAENEDIYKMMQKDLDNKFGYTSKIKRRLVDGWVLKRVSVKKLKDLSAGQSINSECEIREFKDIAFHEITSRIYHDYVRSDNYPSTLIDETGFRRKTTMRLPLQSHGCKVSIETLRSALRNYGFDLVQEKRYRKVLVVRKLKGIKNKN